MVTCRPSYYRVHLHRTRSAPFCFPCFVFPCSCRRLPERNRSTPPAEQHKGLFSFVASIGRDGGQCVLKQGDSRTNSMASIAARGLSRGSCLAVRKPQQRLSSVQLLPENGQYRPRKESRTGARQGDGRGGIPCKIVCDRLYGPDRAVCWQHRRRMIRYRGVCAKVCDG